MNRIDRLHAILVHLQSKRRVTGQELADRFGISLRSVYRDVKALEESGVPVIGEAGIGYSIMEGYRLPPVMFTQEEATAILMGVKLTERFTDEGTRRQIENALFKIKSVLRTQDREHLEQVSDTVVVAAGRIPVDENFNKFLPDLQKAIINSTVVKLVYFAPYKEEAGEVSQREIEPFGLCYYGQAWHCFAWCRLRNDYRDFKLTRIRDLQVCSDKFNRDQHPSLQEYLQRMRKQGELQEVKICFEGSIARYLGEQKYYYGFVSQEPMGDKVCMTFLTGHMEFLGRWLLSFTDLCEVISPEPFKDLVYTLIGQLQKKLPV